MKTDFVIDGFKLGQGKTFIIAEMSCNHNQDFDQAIKIIHEAKRVGANAIKLQTYTPDTMTLNCDNPHFQIKSGTIWDGITLHQLYQKAYTPWEWQQALFDEAKKIGLTCFSSPFDVTAVDFLEEIGVEIYKIASFEVTDHILLKRVAQTGKPVIISTGITELDEITQAVKILRNNGCPSICILKCTSSYPAPIEDANLRTICNIGDTFDCHVGLSDHTKGIEVPIAAVCLGASVIEKHFTLDNQSGSPDDKFSLMPEEFKNMVDSIRKVEQSLGCVKYEKSKNEKKSDVFRRSLFISTDIKAGEKFNSENIRSVRPGNGLHTKFYPDILGRRAKCDLKFGTPMSLEYMDDFKILFLGESDNSLLDYLREIGENVVSTADKIDVEFAKNFDFIISYGYRHIIRQPIIDLFPNKIINLHISMLPWNRGTDPNLWSFLEKTPKGVTIHRIDAGLDTGDILLQKEVNFDIRTDLYKMTLASTYWELRDTMCQLFKDNWYLLKNDMVVGVSQDPSAGSKHFGKEKEQIIDQLEHGWDTTIGELMNKFGEDF